MAFATNLTDNTIASMTHPSHHNDLATAVNRLVAASYNVRAYGADGGGGVDDTTPLQAAIAAAKAAGGGEVFVPKGTYLISATLALPSNVALVGQGMGVSTIKWASGSGATLVRNENDDDHHLTVRALTLDGGPNSAVESGAGLLRLTTSTDCTVQSVEVTGGKGAGIKLTYSQRVTVRGCFVHDIVDVGIDGGSASALTISGNVLMDCGDGIALYAHSGSAPDNIGCTVTGNVVEGTTAVGILVGLTNPTAGTTSVTRGASVTGNTVRPASGTGILVGGGALAGVITDNDVRGGSDGIVVDGGSHTVAPAHLTIQDNTVLDATSVGIYLVSTNLALADLAIGGNIVRGCAGGGIYLRADTNDLQRVSVVGNHPSNNGSFGVGLYAENSATLSGCVVIGNICFDDQSTPTQTYTIWSNTVTGGALTGCTILANRGTGQLRIVGTNHQTDNWQTDSTTEPSGLYLGASNDVRLYRSAAGVLALGASQQLQTTGEIGVTAAAFASGMRLRGSTVGSPLSPNFRFQDQAGQSFYLRKQSGALAVVDNAGNELAHVADTQADTETSLLVRRNTGGTYSLSRVTLGAADSGGTGFKVLRVPN